jgi:cytochrome P450
VTGAASTLPRYPPGPRGYPIIGVLRHLRSDPIGTFLDAADRYGDIVHMKAGPYHGFLLSDPADIRHVLQDNARNYHKSPLFDRVIGDGRPAFAHLERLTRTRRAIDESLRLYPPAWGFSRQALDDDEIGGYHIRKGSLVFLIPFVIHRRPKLWPDPDRFDPDRFDPERESARPRFAYIPFGGGPRGCIGNQFAMTEALLIVAAIAQRFRIKLVPGQAIRPEPLITLRPAPGIRAILEKREAPRNGLPCTSSPSSSTRSNGTSDRDLWRAGS